MAEQQQAAADRPAARERVAGTSGDVLAAQVAKLAELFPEAVAEGRVDFDKLKATLGGAAESGPGRFSFTWAGKDDAVALLQTPTRGTLVPCPDQSVDFDATGNVFIEGENLEVLKLLYTPYFGKVKLIYIDPPYNTGQDFVYPDDFADPLHNYLVQTGQVDDAGNLVSSKVDRAGRVHSAWLSMMYPRLFLARQLLRDDGVICVSIDDHEVHHLRMLMDEVFGAENFIATCVWQKAYTSNMTAKHISDTHDYIVIYARSFEQTDVNRLARTDEQIAKFENPDDDARGLWKAENLSAGKFYAAGQFKIVTPAGREVLPPEGRYWRCNREQYDAWVADNRIWFGKEGTGRPMLKKFLAEVGEGLTPNTWWPHQEVGSNKEASLGLKDLFGGKAVFDTPKPVKLVRRLIQLFTEDDSLVLDFFAGSATTAHAVLEANHEEGTGRQFILIQIPEKVSLPDFPALTDVGRDRIRRVTTRLSSAATGQLDFADRETPEDFGFKVFKLTEPAIRPWVAGDESRDPEAYAERLSFYNDPLTPGAKPGDVVWEVALREGYSLATTMARRELANGNAVWAVADPATGQRMWVCLDDKVRADLSKQLELTPETLLVVRDVALDDTAAANLALQCRLKTI